MELELLGVWHQGQLPDRVEYVLSPPRAATPPNAPQWLRRDGS